MPASISIKHNVKEVTRSLNRFQKKQIPFAVSRAINDTAFAVRRDTQKSLGIYIDRPTPFTKRGVKVKKSSKQDLEGIVYFDEIQAKYMQLQIKGGTRKPQSRRILVPTDELRKNKYGNLTVATRQRLFANKKKYFSTNKGIFERFGPGLRNVRLVAVFSDEAKYQGIFPFADIASKSVLLNFNKHLTRHMDRAIKTARRR